MQKILVIQTAFIGDVVLATALIEKLYQFYPEAKIDFLLRKGNEGLLKDHPFLNEVLIWDKKGAKLRNLFKMLGVIRQKKYDAVINVQRFAATGMLTAFSGAREKIGFDKNPLSGFFTKKIRHIISTADQPLHEVDRNQQLIEALTDKVPAKPRLYPSLQDEEAVQELKYSNYIVIAPASVWYTKQYPVDKWIEFLDVLPQHIQVFIVGAPSDKAMCEKIRTGTKHIRTTNLCGKYNFLQSAALQKDALMNYVNDSAPMHFASAVNAPVTAIYCSTLPSFGFGPLSDRSYIVEIEKPLYCRPCGLHGRASCPERHFKCAKEIRVEQLKATLNE